MKKVEEKQLVEQESQIKSDVELTQDQALNILAQAVKLAQKRGAFELEETEIILKAIRVFSSKS